MVFLGHPEGPKNSGELASSSLEFRNSDLDHSKRPWSVLLEFWPWPLSFGDENFWPVQEVRDVEVTQLPELNPNPKGFLDPKRNKSIRFCKWHRSKADRLSAIWG